MTHARLVQLGATHAQVLQSAPFAIWVTHFQMIHARPTLVLVQMGLQPQEQIVLPTMVQFVQVATRAGLSTAVLASPTVVLVQMGLQPQDQVVYQTILQFAQAAVRAFTSVVLLARLVQLDASPAQVPHYVLAAVRATS
jgi:hypothetical protein